MFRPSGAIQQRSWPCRIVRLLRARHHIGKNEHVFDWRLGKPTDDPKHDIFYELRDSAWRGLLAPCETAHRSNLKPSTRTSSPHPPTSPPLWLRYCLLQIRDNFDFGHGFTQHDTQQSRNEELLTIRKTPLPFVQRTALFDGCLAKAFFCVTSLREYCFEKDISRHKTGDSHEETGSHNQLVVHCYHYGIPATERECGAYCGTSFA